MDQNAQMYRAKVLVQDHREEIMQRLKDVVRELLIEFYRTLNVQPQRIIFYRDGVGEGQFYEVCQHAVRAALA